MGEHRQLSAPAKGRGRAVPTAQGSGSPPHFPKWAFLGMPQDGTDAGHSKKTNTGLEERRRGCSKPRPGYQVFNPGHKALGSASCPPLSSMAVRPIVKACGFVPQYSVSWRQGEQSFSHGGPEIEVESKNFPHPSLGAAVTVVSAG